MKLPVWQVIVLMGVLFPQAHAQESPLDVAGQVAQRWLDDVPPEDLAWNWKPAVLMAGIQQLADKTGDPALTDYIQRWVDHWVEEGVRVHKSDQVVPCGSALYLYEYTGDPVYLDLVGQCRDYLANDAPRLDDGAYAHAVLVPNQIWVDSLFMLGSYWTQEGSVLGESSAWDNVVEQHTLFAGHLRSDEVGLYWHMYDEAGDFHFPLQPVFWGRGNGWVLAGLALLLTELPPSHPGYAEVAQRLRDHARAVMAWQDESGMWYTVVNQACDSYLETSATALFSFGLMRGYHLGLLGEEARIAGQAGIAAVMGKVIPRDDGLHVVDISGSTNPGPCRYYASVPLKEDEPHGVGAVIMALAEEG